ncbi:Invasin [Durusdinium trenchii]|uniref:Invasin n=1 Tax=Durusdinium trenchii TaxID=1381693 RepID=A0ABP0JFN1_9DINO
MRSAIAGEHMSGSDESLRYSETGSASRDRRQTVYRRLTAGGWSCLAALFVVGVFGAPAVANDVLFDAAGVDVEDIFDEAVDSYEVAPFVTRFSTSSVVGEDVGVDDSFSTIEWFMPLLGNLENEMLFGDARGIFRHDGTLGSNLGLGYRIFDPTYNRIFGVNAYWDHLQTKDSEFNQLGIGMEAIGPYLELRSNVYIPDVSDTEQPIANAFVGHQLLVNRNEIALTGVDAEIGASLPRLGELQARVFGGVYHYRQTNVDSTTGWRMRGELNYSEGLALQASVQDDSLFGTTWSIGGVIRYVTELLPPHPQGQKPMDDKFFRSAQSGWSSPINYRLGDPVHRLPNIAVTYGEGTVATDGAGTELQFLHVVNGGAGTGTFDDPYGSLSDALADADAGTAFIYTPYGGTFNEDITLVDGATVLSNGPVQSVTTQFGAQVLPGSGANPSLVGLPQIDGSVTMANDTMLAGFDVTEGIRAINVDGVTLVSNSVANPSGPAIRLAAVSGASISNSAITSAAGDGLQIIDASVDVATLSVAETDQDGISILNLGNDRMVTLSDLTLENIAGRGIAAQASLAGSLELTISGTNTITSTDTALEVIHSPLAMGDVILSLSNLTLASTSGAGINLDGSPLGGTLFVTEMAAINITEAGAGGFLTDRVTFDAEAGTAAIEQVVVDAITIGDVEETTLINGDGFSLIDPTGDLSVTTLTIGNDSGTGLLVDTKGGGTTFNFVLGADSEIVTTNGTAINIDPLSVDMSFKSVTSINSPGSGIILDTVDGELRIANTIVSGAKGMPVVIRNTLAPLVVDFGATKVVTGHGLAKWDNFDFSENNGSHVVVDFASLLISPK